MSNHVTRRCRIAKLVGMVSTVLSVVVGLLFIVTGGVKVVGLPQSLEIRDHFRMSPPLWRFIGALETAGGIGTLAGLAWEPLRLAALVGLAALVVGALTSRLRVHDALGWLAIDTATLGLLMVAIIS